MSAYTYAYTFFQFPFGVAAAAIVAVATPEFARAWAASDFERLGRRFGTAIRQVLAVILPATVTYLVLARPAVSLLLEHGRESPEQARLTAAVLVMFALGLPGYCVYFLTIRAFQAMQQQRTAFFCYLLENGLNIALAFALERPLGIQGLALAYSGAYAVAAVVALVVLRRHIGTIGGVALRAAAVRSLTLALVMAFVLAIASTLVGTGTGLSGWLRLGVAVAIGGAAYLGGAGLAGTLAAWSAARRAAGGPKGGIVAGRHRH